MNTYSDMTREIHKDLRKNEDVQTGMRFILVDMLCDRKITIPEFKEYCSHNGLDYNNIEHCCGCAGCYEPEEGSPCPDFEYEYCKIRDPKFDNCRGYLVKDGAQERVSWAIPSDRAEITIYPNAREELELAAVFAPALDELNAINHTSFTFMESLDLYDRFQIPHVISPTEQGFKSPPSLNRWISSGRYEVLITYKNPEAEPLRHPFDIMYNR